MAERPPTPTPATPPWWPIADQPAAIPAHTTLGGGVWVIVLVLVLLDVIVMLVGGRTPPAGHKVQRL